jgi:methylated-DNA-[protein]-cysteine S-methyltransferase
MAHIFYESPLGRLCIAEERDFITGLTLPGGNFPDLAGAVCPAPGQSSLLKLAREQLEAYFSGRLQTFDLPLAPTGTPYMQRVWQELCAIPYGETATYGAIAARTGNPRAARAVGLANNRNPIAIIIPCHRVIGSNRKLIGYAGGLHLKRALLELEAGVSGKRLVTAKLPNVSKGS